MTELDVSAAAETLGVSERTVRRWLRDGRLEGYKVGGRIRIPERAVREAATPYGNEAPREARFDALVAFIEDPVRKAAVRRRRYERAARLMDEIRARSKPPSGPDDTAEAYVRQGRDEMDAKWDRLLGVTDDP
jgi:excisionase family DNA binding protein